MTSPSPLDRLAGPGNVLAKEPPDAKEFAGLVRSGLARLKDAENEENSLDSRFDLAYSAAHALCLAALRHHGFRPSKRYIVFQVLPDTLGLGPEVWRVLSKCHDMRNRTEYEGVLDVDDRLVSDLIGACRKVAGKVSSLPPIPETVEVSSFKPWQNAKRERRKPSKRLTARTAASSRSPRSCSRRRLRSAARSNRPTTSATSCRSSSCASFRCGTTAGARSSRRSSQTRRATTSATRRRSTIPTSIVASARSSFRKRRAGRTCARRRRPTTSR